jgi:hypothetical protein
MMRNILFLFLPLLIFGYPEALLEKAVMVNEFVENPYTNYYFNPAYLTELKEIFTNDLSKDVIQKYGYDHGVYINGKPNFWLLGASRDEIRHEISKYKI